MSSGKDGKSSKEYKARIMEGSGNVDAAGNFSIEVLKAAMFNMYEINLPNVNQENIRNLEITSFEGFICNRQDHWFAIRKINDNYWNLNSLSARPEKISHFRLAAEIDALKSGGYSIFTIDKVLPPSCSSSSERSRGLAEFWWLEEDLVKDKSDAVNGATDVSMFVSIFKHGEIALQRNLPVFMLTLGGTPRPEAGARTYNLPTCSEIAALIPGERKLRFPEE